MGLDGAVSLGILSTARINRRLIPAARASTKIELVAVASRDRERAAAYARSWEIGCSYGSYEELLADPVIEAVYVSLPNALHVEWSLHALRAGKHVLCEKPLSARPAEVERAFEAAAQARLVLAEAFMYRHNPQTALLLELLAAGAIGEPRLVRSAFGFGLHDPANIRLRPGLDGGALMDVGCYCVHASRLVGGEPESVYGQALMGETGTDRVFTGSLRFASGLLALFDCGTALADRRGLEVVGSGGTLFLHDPWHCRAPAVELRRDGELERVELEEVDSYRLELENFAAAIRGESEPLLGRTDALGQARALEALARSASSARAVVLD